MLKDTLGSSLERNQQDILPVRLVAIHDDQMAVQPLKGMNHPAWILGHLLAIEQKVVHDVLGLPLPTALDVNWWSVYGIDSIPCTDPQVYKSKAFYMDGLAKTAAQIIGYLKEKNDSDFAAKNPDPVLSKFIPTLGSALVGIVNHRSYHCGQLASWRKTMGLPHAGL
jgi:hypothetical protein